MSNLIYLCSQSPAAVPSAETMALVADRITPAAIRGQAHCIKEAPGQCLCLTGPARAAGREGMSARLGTFAGAAPDWHRPKAPVPDGSFALLRSDEASTELCADEAGTRTLWYAFTDGRFIASTSQRAIICLLGGHSLNRAALAWFMSAGNLGPTEAWDSRIRRLPRGGRLLLDRQRWTLELQAPPVRFTPRPMSRKEALEGLRACLWPAIQGCEYAAAEWLLPLSGGYDSRLLLEVLHGTRLRPRTVTWGMAESRTQRGNDAYIARELAAHYGLVNDYLLTEMSDDPPQAVVDTFLAASGGTTDGLYAYLDGLKLWTGFTREGVDGIIRGDEGFGTRPRPEGHHRFAQGLIMLSDFLDPGTAEAVADGGQRMPEELQRQPGETVQAFGDRLVHSIFLPVNLAALNDVKAPFLEISDPMLSGSVLAFVRQMPDALRARRNLYERLIESVSPPIPFATMAADDSRNSFLFSAQYTSWIADELERDFARQTLPPALRASLLAALQGGSESLIDARSSRALLKRLIPTSWVIAARALMRPTTPSRRQVAFRCALAGRMASLLAEDAASLARAGAIGRLAQPAATVRA